MPELPEATTISSQLSTYINGSVLRKLIIKRNSIVKNGDLIKDIIGLECIEVNNYGKMVYFMFPNYWVVFHLALTGYLVVNPRRELFEHSIAEFYFDDNVVVFGAKRMFEKMILYNEYPFDKYGPDFRSVKPVDFVKIMSKHNKNIKVVLMDQKVIAGIGNIYACEALFDSRILPTRSTKNITVQEYYRLYNSLKDIIDLAVNKRGSTISDYIDAFGNKGEYQNYHKIYGKKFCPLCSSKVKTIKIQDRITYYCSTCQV